VYGRKTASGAHSLGLAQDGELAQSLQQAQLLWTLRLKGRNGEVFGHGGRHTAWSVGSWWRIAKLSTGIEQERGSLKYLPGIRETHSVLVSMLFTLFRSNTSIRDAAACRVWLCLDDDLTHEAASVFSYFCFDHCEAPCTPQDRKDEFIGL
jgi:hypothetical protein